MNYHRKQRRKFTADLTRMVVDGLKYRILPFFILISLVLILMYKLKQINKSYKLNEF